ncbi:unnamed protein product [Linum trigynum]|uniref:Uncharacterized protein n=1 Tax=Linum trigynum TaxID=586398 RepID=A0AAV2FST5_9ROSI
MGSQMEEPSSGDFVGARGGFNSQDGFTNRRARQRRFRRSWRRVDSQDGSCDVGSDSDSGERNILELFNHRGGKEDSIGTAAGWIWTWRAGGGEVVGSALQRGRRLCSSSSPRRREFFYGIGENI